MNGRKKTLIRSMRKTSRKNPNGTVSSHLLEWDYSPERKKKYGVYPSIAPKEGKEKSTDPKDWKTQTAREAKEKGEYIEVKTKRRARRLAAGSWKEGRDRREAMKDYRKSRRQNN